MAAEIEKRSWGELASLPKPRNTAELEVLSAWYFGKSLHIGKLRVNGLRGWYEIAEDYNSYNGIGWLHGKYENAGYDYSRHFWRHVFGLLGTGGIARASYGDFTATTDSHREALRLKNLEESWRRKDAGRVRKSLARLAPDFGRGENTAILGSGRVLRDGRVDGASTASLVGAA